MTERRSLLILDLDETLVNVDRFEEPVQRLSARFSDRQEASPKRAAEFVFSYKTGGQLSGRLRPFLDLFIDSAWEIFDDIAVYSAGTDSYVDALVRLIFAAHRPPVSRWGRSRCIEAKIDGKLVFRKDPSALLDFLNANAAGRYAYTKESTLIVDDRREIYPEDFQERLYQIPAFEASSDTRGAPERGLDQDTGLLLCLKWALSEQTKKMLAEVNASHALD